MFKPSWTTIGVLAALASGLWLGSSFLPQLAGHWDQKENLALEEKPTPKVRAVGDASPFPESIRAFGYVETTTAPLPLSAPRAGIVAEVLVRPDDQVQAGDLLLRLDSRELVAKLATGEAEAETIQAQIKAERIDESEFAERYERVRELVKMEAASRRELSDFSHKLRQSRARLTSLEAAKKLAEAKLEEIRIALAQRELRAPVSGKIEDLLATPGAFFEPSSEIPAAVLSTGDGLSLRVLVAESDVAELRAGAAALAYLPGKVEEAIKLIFERIDGEVLVMESFESGEQRYLQVVYRIIPPAMPLVVGQRLDVYLERQT